MADQTPAETKGSWVPSWAKDAINATEDKARHLAGKALEHAAQAGRSAAEKMDNLGKDLNEDHSNSAKPVIKPADSQAQDSLSL